MIEFDHDAPKGNTVFSPPFEAPWGNGKREELPTENLVIVPNIIGAYGVAVQKLSSDLTQSPSEINAARLRVQSAIDNFSPISKAEL